MLCCQWGPGGPGVQRAWMVLGEWVSRFSVRRVVWVRFVVLGSVVPGFWGRVPRRVTVAGVAGSLGVNFCVWVWVLL